VRPDVGLRPAAALTRTLMIAPSRGACLFISEIWCKRFRYCGISKAPPNVITAIRVAELFSSGEVVIPCRRRIRFHPLSSLPINSGPCPKCGMQVVLTVIEPATDVDHEVRTSECPECNYRRKVTVRFR
jgi:DNA-directed RNA polymerase subunit RPC12/RpoP